MINYKEYGYNVYKEDGGLWLKDDQGNILAEVFNSSEGETNDEMYEAGYTPLNLQYDEWISDYDSKEIFG